MADFLSTAQGLPVDYLAQYARRGGGTGGAWKGAAGGALTGASIGKFAGPIGLGVGALGGLVGGGIYGAVTKHAKSAPMDIGAADARDAIARAYFDAYGGTKEATPEFIDQALAGGGSKWAGAQEVNNAIANIRTNAAREMGPQGQPTLAQGGGTGIGYRPGNQLLDGPNKAALLRIFGG
jgi:hypothetical protein